MPPQDELPRIYRRRFADSADYRAQVWRVLTARFFSRWVSAGDAVLDLGCGYGEFINQIRAGARYGMDLNPDSRDRLDPAVRFLEQDCAARWALDDGTLDVVFTSNFLEHLPGKAAVSAALREAFRCLKPGGRLIALGPNIKYLPGSYWDFFDHHTPLTEASLSEALEIEGFALHRVVGRFLPYTMVGAPQYPVVLLRIYLALPWLWWIKGRQFLVIAVRP